MDVFFSCAYIFVGAPVRVWGAAGPNLGFYSSGTIYINFFFHSTFTYLLRRSHHTCHNVFLEVRGQPWGDCSLPPCWSGRWNAAPQVWLQDTLPREASHSSCNLTLDRVSALSVRQHWLTNETQGSAWLSLLGTGVINPRHHSSLKLLVLCLFFILLCFESLLEIWTHIVMFASQSLYQLTFFFTIVLVWLLIIINSLKIL